jgi:hypothetical protein
VGCFDEETIMKTLMLILSLAVAAPAYASHGSDNCDNSCATQRSQQAADLYRSMRERNNPTRSIVGSRAPQDTGSNLWRYSGGVRQDAPGGFNTGNLTPRGSGYTYRPAQTGSIFSPSRQTPSRPYGGNSDRPAYQRD